VAIPVAKMFPFPAQVNERAARLVAGAVVLLLAAAFLSQQRFIVALLAAGFLLRLAWGPRISPLARAAVFVSGRLWPARPVAGAPKRFAQGIGALCTLAACALFASGHAGAAWMLCGLVALFALLEASIAFCMGCWIYARLQARGWMPADACVDCAPPRS